MDETKAYPPWPFDVATAAAADNGWPADPLAWMDASYGPIVSPDELQKMKAAAVVSGGDEPMPDVPDQLPAPEPEPLLRKMIGEGVGCNVRPKHHKTIRTASGEVSSQLSVELLFFAR